MSAPVAIKAQHRDAKGTRANRRLRETGQVPAVIYGHHQETLPLQLNRKELLSHINHGVHVFNLDTGKSSESALLKDVQYDAFGIEVLHVDFTRVDLNERVTVTVSIELKGDPKGEKDGGVLQQILNEIEIECVVTEIPDVITLNVSDMDKDSVMHVSDIKVSDGMVILTDGEQVVCKVEEVTEEAEEETDVAAGEPEVIGAKKEDEPAAEAT